MQSMMRILACSSLVLVALVAARVEGALQAEFFVRPAGNDQSAGTAQQPFASLNRARDAVRTLVTKGLTGDVIVHVGAGTYELTEPLELGPCDSGTAEHAITYRADEGQSVVISGGRRIAGWQAGAGKLWQAYVPAVKERSWRPRQLFVGGQRRTRARAPNDGFYRGIETTDGKTLRFPVGQLANWSHPEQVEFVALVEWTSGRVPLEQIDVEQRKLIFARPALQFWDVEWGGHIRGNTSQQPFYFENAAEMLDTQGEWHVDTASGMLRYWPLEGERLDAAAAVMPRLATLLRIRGNRAQPVENVHFRGFSFWHTDWPLPPRGYLPTQAGFTPEQPDITRPPAAVEIEYADRCTLESCRLEKLGTIGVSLGLGCRRCAVRGSTIGDLSASAIEVGGRQATPDPRDLAVDNVIADNHLHHGGIDYCGCVAVWVGITQGTQVVHNLIHDWPYTGISVGWLWSPARTASRGITVEGNHIHHVLQLLADGGGVYTLGAQPEGVLRGNVIHDIAHYSGVAGNNGFFLDEGSNGWRIEDNVIYSAADGPVRHNGNRPEDHAWGKNFFMNSLPDDGREANLQRILRDAGPRKIER